MLLHLCRARVFLPNQIEENLNLSQSSYVDPELILSIRHLLPILFPGFSLIFLFRLRSFFLNSLVLFLDFSLSLFFQVERFFPKSFCLYSKFFFSCFFFGCKIFHLFISAQLIISVSKFFLVDWEVFYLLFLYLKYLKPCVFFIVFN